MSRRRIAATFGVGALGLATAAVGLSATTGSDPIEQVMRLTLAEDERQWLPPGPPTQPSEPMATGTTRLGLQIRSGSTLGALLGGADLPVNAIREAALPIYDLSRLQPDHELELVYADGESLPVAVRYAVDDDRTVVVERDGETWSSRLEQVPYDTHTETRSIVLTSSLWEDGLAAGLRPDDLLRLAKVFEYELDFNTELVEGARFTLVTDVLVPAVTGDPMAPELRSKLGEIHVVRLVNGAKEHVAVLFDPPNGEPAYFHPDGSGMKRPFLRSPLEFSRVTSGFNPKRFHPILKTARPHNGTDFGAPTGTPVRSVADGKVEFAGVSGGHGNFVKIQHEGGYETSYSHLSKIRVRQGAKVKQGELIGNVGSTGLSTGPHLHFQMWKNGRYVDAMKIDLPKTSSVNVTDMAAFVAERDQWIGRLDAEQPATAAP